MSKIRIGSGHGKGEVEEWEAQPFKKKITYNPNHPKHKAVKNSLEKSKGGMVGELKRTIKDKDLKRDHYADFKKQHGVK